MSLQRDAREFVRNSIAGLGLSRAHLRIRRATNRKVDHLFRATLAERFSAIYQYGLWLNGRPSGSLSGLGSELASTNGIRTALPALLRELDTRNLLDLGCGDFLWMNETKLDCQYTGVDVVEGVIAANNRAYASKTRIFRRLDATIDVLPRADTVLCRDVLFHLCFADVRKVLANVKRSGAAFLIATSDTSLRYNADIVSGDFRRLNLRRPPFCLPSPKMSIPDDRVSAGRLLSVWETCELPELQRPARTATNGDRALVRDYLEPRGPFSQDFHG